MYGTLQDAELEVEVPEAAPLRGATCSDAVETPNFHPQGSSRFKNDYSTGAFAREVRQTEFIARHVWRYARLLFKRHLSKRCSRCILSEHYCEIGGDGVCLECRRAEAGGENGKSAPLDTSEFEAVLRNAEYRKDGNYDALVLFSGGKDSSYLLYRLTRDYPGLRMFVLTVDTGFMSPYAMDNVARVLNRFNVDFCTFRPRPSFTHKAFRRALLNVPKQRGYSVVDLIDAHMIFDTARNFAAQKNIPVILCGLSRVQAKLLFDVQGFEFPLENQRSAPVTYAGINLRETFTPEEMTYWWNGARWPERRIPRFLFPYCVWNPDETGILEEVVRLGLLDQRHLSPLMTNHALIPLIGLAEVARFGYCSWEVEFAEMIRRGKSERTYWLHLFEMLEVAAKTGRFIQRSADETLAALKLSRKDIGIAS